MNRLETSLTALLIAAPLLAAPGLVMAEVIELEEILVSAQLEETLANRTGATVTVVTEDDLKASGETRLVEFLGRLAGVTVTPKGGIGGPAGITLRGASQNYVAVLVDGIDVTDPSAPQVAFDFGQMTTAGISRIEVLKGSQSALYGSRAVGGVINITTRTATEDGTHHYIETEGGSYGTTALSYGVTHRTDRADMAVTLSHVSTDGYSAADENDGNTEADGYRGNRLSFNGSYRLEGGARVGASGFYDVNQGDYDEGYPLGDGSPDEVGNRTSKGLRVFGEFATGAIDHTLAATTFDSERRYRGSTIYGPADYTYTGTRNGLSYQGATNIGANGRLVFGADWAREDYGQTGTYGTIDTTTNTAGLFGEVTYALSDRVDVSATLRHDDHSRFGGATTGRVALAFRVRDDLIIRSQAGTGFRAPSNFELFSFYGSPTLQPEESRHFDLGIEKRYGDRGFVRATAFYLEVDNLIDYDFAGTDCEAFTTYGWPGCYNQVPGKSLRKGIELEGEAALNDRVTLGAAYSYTDSATNASSAWGLLARHDLGLSLATQITPSLSAMLTLQHAADRGALPDFTVMNATLTHTFGNETEAYLRVENLFDQEYQLVNGYGTSDRAVYVGLRARF